MLSRRNVRIKVMQILYALNRDSELSYTKAEQIYNSRIKTAFNAYLYNLYFFQKVAAYSLKDEGRRKSKHLPSEEDLKFSAILATNPLLDSLASNVGFLQQLNKAQLVSRVNMDMVRKLYQTFAEKEEYQSYALQDTHTNKEHKEMLLNLYRFCIKSEFFIEEIEDVFPNWADDESLIVGTTKKTIKSLPVSEFFYKEHTPDAETVEEFGKDLLYKINELDEELLAIIQPALQNWEADRVAILDMILLKMAICEFTHFPSIPTKVTINEYIDISKLYSTPKSKDFINGILDRLLKKMEKEGTINKEGRGLKD